jgi:3-hydroxyisobutyrate dehydrogenase
VTGVALVGVGTMGLPIGRRLIAAGHAVVACDLDASRAAALGAQVAPTPAEAFAAADIAITSLPSVEAVEEVVLGRGGLVEVARSGTAVIEMSTSSPTLARRLAATLEPLGVDVLDAPVSGGPRGAEAGDLTVIVGGSPGAFERHRELLGCLGRAVHVGGHGAGQALKLCNNLLAGTAMAALAEACALATAEGIAADVLYEVLTSSTGDSRVLRTRFPLPGVDALHPATNGYEPLFALDLIAKDMGLALELADDRDVEAPVAAASLESFRAAQRAGLGGLDYSAVYEVRRAAQRREPARERPSRVPEDDLRAFGESVLVLLGASPGAAATVVGCLLEADRRGVHTHGLIRLPAYCAQVRTGEIDVGAEPVVLAEEGPTALVDGRFAFGAVSGVYAVDDAIRRTQQFGVGATAVRNGTHFGSAAHYTLRAARSGLVAIAAANTPAAMAPWGASEARIGNNPLSIAGPGGEGRPPFVLDIAQSASSRGAIKLAELAGQAIPESSALDARGRPTTDPAAALAGALLPVGGHKGSGLAFAVEALTGALAGAGISPRLVNTGLTGTAGEQARETEQGVGYLFVVLDPARFAGSDLFASRLRDLVDELKAGRRAGGVDEILVPGEPEQRAEAASELDGVELPEATRAALTKLAAEEGLELRV